MSDYFDDGYDEYDEEEEEDYYEGEGSGGGGAQGKVFDFKRQLMLNFPGKRMPHKEGIMALHPDITDVEMPRMRNPRFCWVEFATREKAEKAMGDLAKVRLEGGQYITVSWKGDPKLPRRFRRDPDDKKRWIVIEGIPHYAKADEVKESFFGVNRCSIGKKNHRKHVPPGAALLVFNCVKNALAFLEDERQHVYKGRRLKKVRFLREGPHPKSVARKRRRQRRQQERLEYEQRLAAARGNDAVKP
ncbi:uncharacterized protein [Anabrus simplex]